MVLGQKKSYFDEFKADFSWIYLPTTTTVVMKRTFLNANWFTENILFLVFTIQNEIALNFCLWIFFL